MIDRILIKNYAIIENLEIDFSDHLTIITGETGAGKSILLGALGLIMGQRADARALYQEGKKCIVEGVFNVGKYGLQDFFDDNDIDYDNEVFIRREITPSGKSRAFINDTPVNLKLLKRLSSALIDLHQQFDNLDIHEVSFQLRMIDALANNKKILKKYKEKYDKYAADKRRLEELIEQNENANNELDFLEFQLNELNELSLSVGEETELEAELNQLSNSEGIKSALSQGFQMISESEQAITGQLKTVANSIDGIIDFHPKIKSIANRLESLILELDDLAGEMDRIGGGTEYDPERISVLQDRLDLVYRLFKKHQVDSAADLLAIQENLQTKLDAFGDLSFEIEALEQALDEQENDLRKLAGLLSERRKSVVAGFEKKVHKLLGQLSMEHARLKVDILADGDLTATGTDTINFLFAPNKGSNFELIKNVASGGELSRLTLCTKSLVASAIPLPTLIFDEIDTGISGDVALKMGNILSQLSSHHQIVSITHSPQVAIKADKHYYVYKKVKSDRTITNVKELERPERIREIATMLSGSPPSQAAINNAEELLNL